MVLFKVKTKISRTKKFIISRIFFPIGYFVVAVMI